MNDKVVEYCENFPNYNTALSRPCLSIVLLSGDSFVKSSPDTNTNNNTNNTTTTTTTNKVRISTPSSSAYSSCPTIQASTSSSSSRLSALTPPSPEKPRQMIRKYLSKWVFKIKNNSSNCSIWKCISTVWERERGDQTINSPVPYLSFFLPSI